MNPLIVVAVMVVVLASQVAYVARRIQRRKENRERRLKEIGSGVTLKQIERVDGKERIRIIRCRNEAFGAVLERRIRDDWIIDAIANPGAVFESAGVAEVQALAIAPWLSSIKEPNNPRIRCWLKASSDDVNV